MEGFVMGHPIMILEIKLCDKCKGQDIKQGDCFENISIIQETNCTCQTKVVVMEIKRN